MITNMKDRKHKREFLEHHLRRRYSDTKAEKTIQRLEETTCFRCHNRGHRSNFCSLVMSLKTEIEDDDELIKYFKLLVTDNLDAIYMGTVQARKMKIRQTLRKINKKTMLNFDDF